MALITKQQAIDHIKPGDPDEIEADLELKMAIADSHVLTYLKREEADLTATELVIAQGAALEVLTNIFYDRGDRDTPSDGPITPRIKNALAMLRDPALA